MLQQTDETLGWPDKPRAIALIILVCIAGFLVWSFHQFHLPAFIATFVICCIAGYLAGGLVGVPLVSSLTTMFMFAGLFEGLVRGWSTFGLLGAVLYGTIGAVAAVVVCMLLLMLVTFVIVLRGDDPFVNTESTSEHPIPEKPDASQQTGKSNGQAL
jgi:hypothetical protein